IEKDFPINTGSKIDPKTTWTRVIASIKKSNVLVGSSSTKAKIDKLMTEIKEPIICTKLIRKTKNPQKIGKLTSKYTQASPVKTPVPKLTKNLTLINLIKSFSIFRKVLTEVCFCFNMVAFNNFSTLMDSAN